MARTLCLAVVACLVVLAGAQFSCSFAPTTPGDRRSNTNQLSFATLNAEFLFYNSDSCPDDECPWGVGTQAAWAHINAMAAALTKLNADVVILEEVEDCDVLAKLLSAMDNGDEYRYYLVKGTDTSTRQNVALITRVDPVTDLQRTATTASLPVAGSKCWDAASSPSDPFAPARLQRRKATRASSTSVSKNLYTTLEVDGLSILLIGLHFKAIPTEPASCEQREGQAQIIAELVASQAHENNTQLHTVIMGDFNDFDPSLPVLTYQTPTSRVFEIIKNSTDGYHLYNVGASVSGVSSRFSNWWDKNNNCQVTNDELTTIDHILLSPGLKSRIISAAYVHNVYAFDCADLVYSDHAPVMVVLDTTARK